MSEAFVRVICKSASTFGVVDLTAFCHLEAQSNLEGTPRDISPRISDVLSCRGTPTDERIFADELRG